MQLDLEEGRKLIEAAMISLDHSPQEAAIISDHLIDCELRGLGYAGLARAVTIAEYIRNGGLVRGPIELLRETPVSAHLNGNGTLGYLVAHDATQRAIDKASSQGMAVVGASGTYYTGMFSYYLEMVTKAGLIGMIAGSGPSLVAPYGGTQARLCTNPIAFGFPTDDIPMIWDIGTGIITHAEVVLARRLGQALPEGIAFDRSGARTTTAADVLDGGAITNWGGPKGYGLSLSIQLLSMMAGQVNDHSMMAYPMDCGFFMTVYDPALFGSRETFREVASSYLDLVADTAPDDPSHPVRVPFGRSYIEREERRALGVIEVADEVVAALRGYAPPAVSN